MRLFGENDISGHPTGMDRSTVRYQGRPSQPSGSQGTNPEEPPVKEIRTYMRDGTTITEEYERLNPDGTVTKTVSVGDRRDGLKHFGVYKMDKSGIVRKVDNVSPEQFFADQASIFGVPGRPMASIRQAEVTPLAPPPTMQQQLIALKDVVKDASREVQEAAFDDYKDRLIRYGTRKLEKVLRRKLDEDIIKGEFTMTPEKTEQLMDYGVSKLHNLLNKTLDKEKFLMGDFGKEAEISNNAVAPKFSFTFHPLNSAGTGESKTRPLTFTIKPTMESETAYTLPQDKKEKIHGGLKTFLHDVLSGSSSSSDESRRSKKKSRDEIFDEEDYDDNVEMKRKELKNYLKQDIKRGYTSDDLADKADVYEYAMNKVDNILKKATENGEDAEYVDEKFRSLEKNLKKMMRERDPDDVSPKKQKQREDFLKMAFRELRDSVKNGNSDEEKPKKKMHFSDLVNEDILKMADKKMKKMMDTPAEVDEDDLEDVTDSEIEKILSKKSSSRRKELARSDQSSDDDDFKWTTSKKEGSRSSSEKETKTPKLDFDSFLSEIKGFGGEKQKAVENQTEKKVKKSSLDFDTFLSNIRNGISQESNHKLASQSRQIPQERTQEIERPRSERPRTLESLLENLRQPPSKTSYKPQPQQTNSSPQYNSRAFVNSGFEALRQPDNKPTSLESLISNIYKMNNPSASESSQKVHYTSSPPRPQTERKVNYTRRDDDDDDNEVSFKIKVHPQNNAKLNQSSGGLGSKSLNIGNSNNEAMPWWFNDEPKPEPKIKSTAKHPFMQEPSFPSFGGDPFSFFNQALGGGSLFPNGGSPALAQ